MKKLLVTLFITHFFTQVLVAQVDVRMYPSRIFYYQQEGRMQEQIVHLVNKSNKRLVFKAEIMDWKRDSMGVKKYTKMNTMANNASNLFYLNQNMITVEPMQDKMVKVFMNLHSDTIKFNNAMLFFTQVNTDSTKKGMVKLVQLGVHLYYLQHKNVDKHLVVNKVWWSAKPKDSVLLVDIKNNTGAVIDSELNAELINEKGEIVAESKKTPISSMPGDAFCVPLVFNNLNKKNGNKIIIYIENGMEHPLQVVEVPAK